MKKLALTIAIVLTMGLGAFAQHSLLGKSNAERTGNRDLTTPAIMETHNYGNDLNGNGQQPAPLGSGIAVLVGLGAAYVVAKKRKEE
jgi:hypothetical protein